MSTIKDKAILLAQEVGAGIECWMTNPPSPALIRMKPEQLESLIQLARNRTIDEALNCYSRDDTAQDWADKIRSLKGK